MKEKVGQALRSAYGQLASHPRLALRGGFAAVVVFYLLGLLFWVNLAIPVWVCALFLFVVQMLLHDKLDEKQNKISAWLLVAAVGVSLAALIAWPCISASRATGIRGVWKTLAMAAGFIAVMSTLVFARSDTGVKGVKWLAEKSLSVGQRDQEDGGPGDITLCLDKEATEKSGKPVPEVIPYEDRFLHMLVLGPTGTGKTSQILLPMINQDLSNPAFGVTVLEPKGDLAQQAAMMAEHYGRPYVYFDPSMAGCPFYNPLIGPEDEVMESMTTTFRMLNTSSSTYFLDQDEHLARNAIKVLKRLDAAEGVQGKYANFVTMARLLQNSGNSGRDIINKFRAIAAPTEEEGKENFDIASWFLNDYMGERSKVYQDTSELRTQLAKINANTNLRRVLNPDVTKGERSEIDFEALLADGGVLCVSTAQGALGRLGSFLGYFLVLQFQAATFRRPGDEDTRRAHALYIDEFQTYSNPGFSDMLTQGRSYRVACVLATQARAQMAMGGGNDGKHFVDLVDANARHLVVFPGVNYDDAKYYSNQFGEIKREETMRSVSRKRFNLITGGLDRLGHPSESIRYQEKSSALFSPTDITNRPFGEVTYRLIQHKSVQRAKVGVVQFIPPELRQELRERIAVFQKDHQFAEEEAPKAATGIVWDDGDMGVEDLAAGEPVLELPQEAPVPEAPASPRRPSGRSATPPDLRSTPVEEESGESVLDWDLLDTSGDPEDGFADEPGGGDEEDDDLLGA